MPKIVDHDERRAEIVDAFLRLVARDGYERAGSRALAQELGMASGNIWHYFDSFDAVLQAAAVRAVDNTTTRIALRSAGQRGLARMRTIARELLPTEKVTRDEAAVVVGFFGKVAGKPGLAEALSGVSLWWEELTEALDQAVDDGELHPAVPIQQIVQVFAALVNGLQVNHVVATVGTSGTDQLALVDTVLDPWRV